MSSSLAWTSLCVAGLFEVGPESVGAHPGPVCYGRAGATQPAITDANLVLGRLVPDAVVREPVPQDRSDAMHAVLPGPVPEWCH